MVIRLRHMAMGIILLAALVSIPLLTVWRHVCMRSIALEQIRVGDSLVVVKQDVERLRGAVGQLSERHRIESLARQHLKLEYPSSDRIEIIRTVPGQPDCTKGEAKVVRTSFPRNPG